jgi:hypothetical protein
MDKKVNALFTEHENYVIHETMPRIKSSGYAHDGTIPVVYIYMDHIRIDYAAYLLADLMIVNPPIELEESEDYLWYTYGIKVNDDWGIFVRRESMGG